MLGPAAAIIGTLLSAGFVVAAELPAPTVVEPALRAVLRRGRILGDSDDGAGVAPPPWKDATLAVAHCYRGLADFADALAGMYSGLRPETGAPAWSAVSRSQRATLRAALEAARSRIGEVQGARPSRRTRAQQLYYLLDRAEDSFIAMVAAADLLESNAPRWLGRNAGAHLCHALHRYASVCNAIAGTSDAADARQADRLRERLERYGADLRELRGPRSRTRRAGQRHSGAGPAATVRPVRPAGPVRRRRAAGRRGIQLGRRAGAASLEHAAPEPATGV